MSEEKKINVHFLAGMPRAGTTFLYHNLNRHPDIYIPFRRKTNYFSLHYKKPLKWFYEHFEDCGAGQVGLDTDTLSFISDESYERFLKFRTNEKVILVVRDPAEWAESLYKQIDTFAFDLPEFSDYLENGYTLIEDGKRITYRFRAGDVKEKIERYIKDFGEGLLLIDFKLIAKDPLLVLKEIESFLNVRDYYTDDNIESQKINSSDRKSNKYIAALLRTRIIIGLIKAILPRKLAISIRAKYDKMAVKGVAEVKPSQTNQSELFKKAESQYQQDISFVNDLFKEEKILKY